MTLRSKTIWAIVTILIVTIIILYSTFSAILIQSFQNLENKYVMKNTERVFMSLQNEVEHLSHFTDDWAAWDDTYKFVIDRNKEYIHSNLVDSTFVDSNLNLIAYFNTDGEMVYGRVYDPQIGKQQELPETLREQLSSDSAFIRHIGKSGNVKGILKPQQGPALLIAARPVLTSNGEGPVRGVLVMGRIFDEKVVQHLSEMAIMSIKLHDIKEISAQESNTAVYQSLDLEAPLQVGITDTQIINGYRLLKDVYQQPAYVLEISLPRDIYHHGKASLNYILIMLLTVGLVTIISIIGLMNRLVLNRLMHLGENVSSICDTYDLSKRLITDGDDEISHLTNEINKMLTDIEKSHENLQKYEHIVSASIDLLAFFDKNYICQAVNDAFLNYFHKRRDEFIGHHVSEALGQAVFENQVKLNMDRCLSGEHVNFRVWLDFPGKGRRYMDVYFYPFRESDGSISGIAVNIRDITVRKQAEDEIRRSQEGLRNLTSRLHKVREEERSLISREIHDKLGQTITGLRIDLAWILEHLPERNKELTERARATLQLVDETLETVRRFSYELRPAMLDDLGLIAAIEWQAREFSHRTGCICKLNLEVDDFVVDDDRNTVIFRILQEALTNVARHARANHVEVSLHKVDSQLVLMVKDNGVGISNEIKMNTRSLGLISMQERASAFGGKIQIKAADGGGAQIILIMPVTGKAA